MKIINTEVHIRPPNNFNYDAYSLPYKLYELRKKIENNRRIVEETEKYPDLFTTRINTFKETVAGDEKAIYDLLGIAIPPELYSIPPIYSFPVIMCLVETKQAAEIFALSTISN